ncbi:hypothetical protein DAPPUDRAFT_314024 [Daphnia pulex]|uniref:Uncharacterized protein n=1 Tax=Daphnia pulex TaxID=6669 RepID=E9G4H0_DAPPU|nr:hypothetical protein DAPPUDRAFT_314024 [Daphnia pulex]|eukprot:EFX85298.1 hypothetical protein DAPPUDRAFT_314024 [Daphnia pulex]
MQLRIENESNFSNLETSLKNKKDSRQTKSSFTFPVPSSLIATSVSTFFEASCCQSLKILLIYLRIGEICKILNSMDIPALTL